MYSIGIPKIFQTSLPLDNISGTLNLPFLMKEIEDNENHGAYQIWLKSDEIQSTLSISNFVETLSISNKNREHIDFAWNYHYLSRTLSS